MKKETKKTAKKNKKAKKGGSPKQKYDYPPNFLTKKGTLKKSHLKKAAEFRKRYGTLSRTTSVEDASAVRKHKSKTKKKNRSNLSQGQLDFLEGIKTGTSSPDPDEMLSFENLPVGIDEKLFDELVFENKGRGRMGPERCRRLREFCTLYPRTCASDAEFREKYVKPCTERGRHIKDEGTYQEYLNYKSAITPQAISEARTLNTQNWRMGAKYDIPASAYARHHMRPTELNSYRKLGSMKKHGSTALADTLKSMRFRRNRGGDAEANWAQLQELIINNPDSLDDILGNFKVEARKHGYNDRTIDYMIRRIIDEMYIEY